MPELPHILVVDDEPFNVEIITELLAEEGLYKISSAEDGQVAIDMLEASPESFDVILLDRMMPNMDGMAVLERVKQHTVLSHCPVIFQTAKTEISDITEGLEAGAHYYLTKPFEEEVLLSVVKTAVQDRQRYKGALRELDKNRSLMGLLKQASFEFKNLDEARNLAALLSHAFPEPGAVVMGLTELMINAIEHGNLAITYAKKSELNQQGKWNDEVEHRLTLPEYINRKVQLTFSCSDESVSVTITDEGDGFNWQTYMEFDPERVMDSHGRGIAMANQISFSELEYRGKGNTVCATLKLAPSTE